MFTLKKIFEKVVALKMDSGRFAHVERDFSEL